MYFKVALLISSLALIGCTNTAKPQPKPQQQANLQPQPQEVVVEELDTKIIPIKKEKVVEKDKYNFKPEPFSLKSNEDDPELLGPQSTIDREALNSNKSDEGNKDSKTKKPIKKEKKSSQKED